MLQKIRSVMGKRDAKYQIAGYIELDDAFFEIGDPNQKPIKPAADLLARSELVAVESEPTENQFCVSHCPTRRWLHRNFANNVKSINLI